MKILFIIGLTILVACTKSSDVSDACLDKILKEHDMVPYREGDQSCTRLYMVECGSNNYFMIDVCHADPAFEPFDCDGNFLARLNGDKYGEYYPANLEKYGFGTEKCKSRGIVGVRKQ